MPDIFKIYCILERYLPSYIAIFSVIYLWINHIPIRCYMQETVG